MSCLNEAQLNALASFFETKDLNLTEIEWHSNVWEQLCERLNALGRPTMDRQCWHEIVIALKIELQSVLQKWADSHVFGFGDEAAPLTDLNKRLVLAFGLLKSFDKSSTEYLENVVKRETVMAILGELQKHVMKNMAYNSVHTDVKKEDSFDGSKWRMQYVPGMGPNSCFELWKRLRVCVEAKIAEKHEHFLEHEKLVRDILMMITP